MVSPQKWLGNDSRALHVASRLTIALLAVALLASGFYRQGLLPIPDQYLALAVMAPLEVLFLGLAWPCLPRRDWRSWVLGLFVAADLLALAQFASLEFSLLGLAIKVAGAGLYLLGWQAAGDRQALEWIRTTLLAGLAVPVLGAYLILAGLWKFPGAIEGQRLSSTLQYPNTFAAVALLTALAAAVPPRATAGLGWRHPMVYASLLVLVFPNSRGVWLVLPLVLLGLGISLWRQAPHVPVVLAAHAVVAFAVGIPLMAVKPPWTRTQWQTVFLGLALSCTLVPLLEWVLRRRPALKWATLLAGTAAVAAAAAWQRAAMGPVVGRFAKLPADGGTMDRIVHLLDGLKASIHLPLGAGYLGWQVVYQQFQSYRYTINILHSHPVEVLVSSGWLGLLALLGLWGGLGYSYWQWARRPESAANLTGHGLFWGLVALGLHSFGDVDLNFVSLLWLVFAGWGLFHRLGAGERASMAVRPTPGWRWALAAAGLLLGGVGTFGYLGNTAYRQSLAPAREVPEVALPLAEKAVALVPWSGDHRLQRGAVKFISASKTADPRRAEELLRTAAEDVQVGLTLSRGRPEGHNLLGRIYALLGELDQAGREFERAAALAPWHLPLWEDALEFRVNAARALRSVSLAEAQKQKEAAAELLRQLEAQKQRVPAWVPVSFDPRTARLRALIKQMESLP